MTPAESRLRDAIEHGYPLHTLTLEDGRALLAEIDNLRRTVSHEADCVEAAKEEVEALRAALINLIRGYVNLLEIGRDRIVELGGQCDPVDQMEASDPYLLDARAALAQAKEG